MDLHWRDALGFTVPNASTYPWLYLWDSCFHSIIWAALGHEERARRELGSVFAAQTPAGFVPHVNYDGAPGAYRWFWGVSGTSTITQPPMYGHALRVLHRAGIDVEPLITPVTAALHHLFQRRRTGCGLLRIVHPWENGTDDSPRWEQWQTRPFDLRAWWETKGRLVKALRLEGREAIDSDEFTVCPAGWNALVAWNAAEAAKVSEDKSLANDAAELAAQLDRVSWDEARGTWVDVSPCGVPTSAVRTVDGLLGVLTTCDENRAARVLDLLADPAQYGAPYGPAGVHPDEGTFDPSSYWRGAAWPQLNYLWRTAADRRGDPTTASLFDRSMTDAMGESGAAEFHHPFTGGGLGASPQSWSCLAAVPRSLSSPSGLG